MKKKYWQKLLPLTGIAILSLVIWQIGITNIIGAFNGLDYMPLSLLPLLILALLLVQTLKWKILLDQQNIVLPFIILFRINLIGLFYGTITPGRAGILIKAHYVALECGRDIIAPSSSIIIDKFIELIILGFFASLSSYLLTEAFGYQMVVSVLLLTGLLLFLAVVFYSKATASFLGKWFLSFLVPKPFRENINRLGKDFYQNIPLAKTLLKPFIFSVLAWLLIWGQMYVVAVALGINISYWQFIILVSISSLVALIPISINGIGTRELALVPIMSLYGIPSEKTVAMSLLSLLFCVYLPAIIGASQTPFFTKKSKAGSEVLTDENQT